MKSCNYLKSRWLLKSLFVFTVLSISLFSCKKDSVNIAESSTEISNTNSEIYSVEEIRTLFDQKKPLDWKTENDAKFIYSVGMQTDSIFAVGYKPETMGDVEDKLHLIDITTEEWRTAEETILNIIEKEENKKKENFYLRNFDPLPIFLLKVENLSTIEKLIDRKEVRFIEPLNPTLFESRNLSATQRDGTNLSSEFDAIASAICWCENDVPLSTVDFTTISPNVTYPWNFGLHNINQATWDISTGNDIGVAIIDSGVDHRQENLDGFHSFNSGQSMDRIEKRYNFLTTVLEKIQQYQNQEEGTFPLLVESQGPETNDRCGHGTRMAGLVAAPRGGDGNAVGVAYNCDLYNMRAAHDPLINKVSEILAVADAFTNAAGNSNIKIISMSMGMGPNISSSIITNAISLAYGNDKLILCAAGTTFDNNWLNNGVLFPASLSTTIAVTGIKEPPSYPGPLDSNTEAGTACHYGAGVDFAVIMERVNNSARTAIALTCDGDVPVYNAGSSCATATMAGIAALVWADQGLSASRDIIEGILIQSGSNYLSPHSDFGFGWVDVDVALQF